MKPAASEAAVASSEVTREEPEADPTAEAALPLALEDLVPTPASAHPAARLTGSGMRTARVIGVSGHQATITFRGQTEAFGATIAPEVDPAVIADAVASGDCVLVELTDNEAPLVVAVLHTQRPREIRLKAATIRIEGEDEVLLRAGRSAIRIRSDGDIEVVGSRISAASRGLFRIVGRMLRLN